MKINKYSTVQIFGDCERCGGDGIIERDDHNETCPRCGGSGAESAFFFMTELLDALMPEIIARLKKAGVL